MTRQADKLRVRGVRTPDDPDAPSASGRSLFGAGMSDMGPVALGYVPFAVAIGTAVGESTVDNAAGWSGSFLIAAGSAHLATVEMLDSGAAVIVACATALMINSRLLVYAVGLAPWFSHERPMVRAALAYFVIDPLFILVTERFERDDPGLEGRRHYYLGAAIALFSVWILGMTAGTLAGAAIPGSLRLSATAPLMMAAMLGARLTSSTTVVVASSAGLVAIGAGALPLHASILVAIAVGVGVGAAVQSQEVAS